MRLFGCDTPEITNAEARCDVEREWGERAKARLGELLNSGPITVNVTFSRDRYKRPIIWIGVHDRNVCATLIEERLAVAYFGRGPRMDWCPRNRGRSRSVENLFAEPEDEKQRRFDRYENRMTDVLQAYR